MPYKISNYHCLAYALPVITTTWLMAPISVIQGIYAKYYGLPLTTIATLLLLTRLFDAFLDPLIGYYADRYYKTTKTFKPFMVLGGLLFVISGYFLYVPPLEASAIYLMTCLFGFYFSWTLFEIPHLAWPSELALVSEDKTKIYGARNMASYAGLLLFYATPLLPFFEGDEITPETLKVSVLIAGTLMILFLVISMKTKFITPELKNNAPQRNWKKSDHSTIKKRCVVFSFSPSLVNNRPLLIFIAAYLFISLSTGIWYSLIFLYVDAYLCLGDQFAKMFLLAFSIGVAATPAWLKLAFWLGKKTTWTVAALLLISSFIYTGSLLPGNTNFTELVMLKSIQTLGFTCMGIMAPAMLAEIIDFSNWKYRTNKRASFFALYSFMYKTTVAIGTALGLGIAGWYGFDATKTVHSEQSTFALTFAIAWLPSLLGSLSLIFILVSPINERRHAIISRRLNTN